MEARMHRSIRSTVRIVIAVLALGACASASSSASSLAAYAAGRWSCRMSLPGKAGPTWTATATVSTASESTGRVAIVLPLLPGEPPNAPRRLNGDWRLNAGKLAVKWDDKSMGTVAAQPISANSTHFQIREDSPGQPGRWAPIGVSRHASSVGFSFALPDATPVDLVCNKA